jgi:threonine aldolase
MPTGDTRDAALPYTAQYIICSSLMPKIEIDLYSDTKTRPTKPMREAIAAAEVGDEQQLEDPSVERLLARACSLLEQEAAVFLPSGTMANQIAVLVHCRPGDELIADESSHIICAEGGAPAALAGVMIRPLKGLRGLFTREMLREAVRVESRNTPTSRLVVIEQTANIGGGTVWPLDQMMQVIDEARNHKLAVHMDGARLMNASVARGVPPAAYSRMLDSVYLDFTKGLGAPFGAILSGSRNFIARAWRWKQRLGGSMRQAGMMAAACLYSLDHHVERLHEDHENARSLADQLAAIPGIAVEPVDTNIVFFDVAGVGATAETFNEALKQRGTRAGAFGPTRLRFVTHMDVSREQIQRAAKIVAEVARTLKR